MCVYMYPYSYSPQPTRRSRLSRDYYSYLTEQQLMGSMNTGLYTSEWSSKNTVQKLHETKIIVFLYRVKIPTAVP
jgi:hypothetical protein